MRSNTKHHKKLSFGVNDHSSWRHLANLFDTSQARYDVNMVVAVILTTLCFNHCVLVNDNKCHSDKCKGTCTNITFCLCQPFYYI